MNLENVEITSLTPDPNNARKHDEQNLSVIAASLEQFGQRKPIVVTEDLMVVAGNGTLEAARSLGWSEIAVVKVPADWDANTIKAFALADNRSSELSDWDKIALAEQLQDLQESDFDIETIGFEAAPVLDFLPVSEDSNPSLDERVRHVCPHCDGLFEMVSGSPRAVD